MSRLKADDIKRSQQYEKGRHLDDDSGGIFHGIYRILWMGCVGLAGAINL